MSPEPKFKAAVLSAPTGARVADVPFDQALGNVLERRVEAARARGARDAQASLGIDIEGAVARLDASREQAVEQLAHTAVELALEITRSLLRTEIPEGRYDLEAIVREALAFSGTGRGRCTVHVNPVDAAKLEQVQWRAGTEIEPDHEVARGSVHITTPQGLLVRDIDDAITSIRERLLGEVQ